MGNKLYQETSIQAVADALRLKRDGAAESYRIAQMDDAVLSLPFGNIPACHYKEAGTVVKRILDLKAAHPNHILFGTVSDHHADQTDADSMASVRHAAFALEAVGALAECDFVVNLGDNPGDLNVDTDTGYANSQYVEQCTRFALTHQRGFSLVGNHDKSNSTQRLFDLMGKFNDFDDHGLTRIRGYGYKDFPEKKVRVICLNTCDYWNAQGGNGMSYEQKDFLIRALDLSELTGTGDWTIIVLSHFPLDFLGGDYNKGEDLKAILSAYVYGGPVSIQINDIYAFYQNEDPSGYETYHNGGLKYDYLGRNLWKVVNVHGHIHNNAVGRLKFLDDDTTLNIVRIATANAGFHHNYAEPFPESGDYRIPAEEAARIAKVSGSQRDTSATFYFFDLEGKTVYAIGYGADVDRVIPYQDAAVYSVMYDLENVLSSSMVSSVAEGVSYTTVLTALPGHTIQSIQILMGGEPVSLLTEAGRVHIPRVTGDIVIFATAAEDDVVCWDIGARTAVTDLTALSGTPRLLDQTKYWYGAVDTGACFHTEIISCALSGNDVTFISASQNVGIGVPYQLDAGASYTFTATASVDGRLRVCFHHDDGTYLEGGSYSGLGTELSMTFDAPTEEGAWVMLLLDCFTPGQEITYSNITLAKNRQPKRKT